MNKSYHVFRVEMFNKTSVEKMLNPKEKINLRCGISKIWIKFD